VNVHASILPRWRGAAPIQWSIASGDSHAGVSLMAMDEGMDTGAVYAVAKRAIEAKDTAGTLSVELAAMGAELLKAKLEDVVHHSLPAVPQPDDGVTHARMLTKEDARIDWTRSASAIDAHRRGMTPWPGCFTTRGDERVKIHDAAPTRAPSRGAPGEVLELDERGLLVNCGEGVLALKVLQPAGRKRLDAQSYVAGYGMPERFGAF
ncbi:MAG: methionyl-tRNA formyltransferase, partial [Myxococcota bacterium]